MKELSIEEKAKAYDELLVRLQDAKVDNDVCDDRYCCVIDVIVPELKESEDERIRKELIELFHDTVSNDEIFSDYGLDKTEVLAWLEKQGEQKPQGKTALEAINEEKVDNQNCVRPADKVEPKFKNGQWIVWQDKCYKVNYNGCGYELIDQNGLRTSLEYGTIDENAHLWTIKDAKDGDVLVSRSPFIYGKQCPYGGLNWCNNKFIKASNFIFTDSPVHPATKEQRDTLERAMTNAGYTFDFNMKELKKIVAPKFKVGDTMRTLQEASSGITSGLPVIVSIDNEYYHCNNELIAIKDQNNYEYPPMNKEHNAWSEEDMSKVQRICKYLNEAKKYYADIAEVRECIEWLKSLKP